MENANEITEAIKAAIVRRVNEAENEAHRNAVAVYGQPSYGWSADAYKFRAAERVRLFQESAFMGAR